MAKLLLRGTVRTRRTRRTRRTVPIRHIRPIALITQAIDANLA
jgi:hypothetical protein